MLYLTLRQIEYVVAVAHAGSLAQAAQNLHVSQPALSVALNLVEEKLGQKLFIRRKGSPITLTAFAQNYISEAEKLLAQAQRLEDPAALARIINGTLTLGCFDDLAPTCLAPVLQSLRAHLPDVALRWRIQDFESLARDMREGQIDLAITYDLGLDSSFDKTALRAVSPHAFIAPQNPLATLPRLHLADLATHPLILFEEGLSIRHMLNLFRMQGHNPKVIHRVRALEVMRSLAAADDGVGIAYTRPPGDVSYDGNPVLAREICDSSAIESIILARSNHLPPSNVISTAANLICQHFIKPAAPDDQTGFDPNSPAMPLT
ncbi:LysR family transcriptional regulator [Thalassospira marina]|uniref:LysR family transcriptional regulator n=1 Tax=Thalassospira marina TaxID=2048283 RepID=A0ABM6Q693_9PROT|nr:LysR family transcriptional regulator [Thalassospira marina]AUG51958.1 LysR family transcriptional regulator [Thalassospira marina]